MSVQYRAVQWNRQKRIYDAIPVGSMLLFVAVFVAVQFLRSTPRSRARGS